MRIAALCLALLTLLAGGCGGGNDDQSAREVLAETSRNLGEIGSGDLGLDLLFTAKGGDRAGFTLEGPFELREGRLPQAQLDYTQVAGDATTTQTFILADDKAYVSIRGKTFELPASTGDQLRSSLGRSGGLGVIDLT